MVQLLVYNLSALQVRVLASFLQLQLRLVVLIYHRPSPSLGCLIVIDTRFRTFLHLLRRWIFNIWRRKKNDSAFIVIVIVILKCIWRQVGFCALSSVLQSCFTIVYMYKFNIWTKDREIKKNSMTAHCFARIISYITWNKGKENFPQSACILINFTDAKKL